MQLATFWCLLFFRRNNTRHFMWILGRADYSHEMFFFLIFFWKIKKKKKKKKKKKIKVLSAVFVISIFKLIFIFAYNHWWRNSNEYHHICLFYFIFIYFYFILFIYLFIYLFAIKIKSAQIKDKIIFYVHFLFTVWVSKNGEKWSRFIYKVSGKSFIWLSSALTSGVNQQSYWTWRERHCPSA